MTVKEFSNYVDDLKRHDHLRSIYHSLMLNHIGDEDDYGYRHFKALYEFHKEQYRKLFDDLMRNTLDAIATIENQ